MELFPIVPETPPFLDMGEASQKYGRAQSIEIGWGYEVSSFSLGIGNSTERGSFLSSLGYKGTDRIGIRLV